MDTNPVISILGGTGKEGLGLALRFSKAGYRVIIGSRSSEKAEESALNLNENSQRGNAYGMTNERAAEAGDIIILSVPYPAHQELCKLIKPYVLGKIVVDVTVPLAPPQISRVHMPEAGSATLEAKQLLGEGVNVIAAFQNISYEHLMSNENIECDVLVCGDGREARKVIMGVISTLGMTAWDAGPIENSVVVEGLTSVLLGLNKQHGVKTAGIKITGITRA